MPRRVARITITDPCIRMFHQQRNLMDLMETLSKVKSIEDEASVHLITIEDELKAEQQVENLQKIAEACAGAGITFIWDFDSAKTIHARHIVTDQEWKILLDCGLDVFQRLEMSDTFCLSNRLQQHHPCKQFEATFIRMEF
ncbi:MAG: MIT C-terminal domain-containing protein [Pseudoxanthomonas sp.]